MILVKNSPNIFGSGAKKLGDVRNLLADAMSNSDLHVLTGQINTAQEYINTEARLNNLQKYLLKKRISTPGDYTRNRVTRDVSITKVIQNSLKEGTERMEDIKTEVRALSNLELDENDFKFIEEVHSNPPYLFEFEKKFENFQNRTYLKEGLKVHHPDWSDQQISKIVKMLFQHGWCAKVEGYLGLPEIVKGLKEQLKLSYEKLRPIQIETIQKIIDTFEFGDGAGYVKLPTGTGKTRIMSEVIKGTGKKTVVFVPRTNLLEYTKESLVEVGVKENHIDIISGNENGNTIEQFRKFLKNPDTESLLVTYQSVNTLRNADPNLFTQFCQWAELMISDEAHWSLGGKTREAIEELERVEEDVFLDPEVEHDIETAMKEYRTPHLLFTATPNLVGKSLSDFYGNEIISKTVEQVAEMGDIIIPKEHTVGIGTIVLDEETKDLRKKQSLSNDDIERLANDKERFRDENNNPLYQTILNKYEERKKTNGNYAPGVGFCATIDQAKSLSEYYNSIHPGRAVVVSSKDPTSAAEAKRRLEANEIDIVFTPEKVGEGWDVPTLRQAMWFYPTGSERKAIQGTGRIMRIMTDEEVERIHNLTGIDRKYIRKTEDNTGIIEVDSWMKPGFEFVAGECSEETEPTENKGIINKKKASNYGKLTVFKTVTEMLYASGEISRDRAIDNGVNVHEVPVVGLNGRVMIGDVEYQWVSKRTHKSHLRGFSGKVVLNRIKSQTNTWHEEFSKSAKASNGSVITVFKLNALEVLMENDWGLKNLTANEKVHMDGKDYQRLSERAKFLSRCYFPGKDIMKIVAIQSKEWKEKYIRTAKAPNNNQVLVVEIDALETLLNSSKEPRTIDEHGRVVFGGKIYKRVGKTTASKQLWGFSGPAVMQRVRKQSNDWKNNYLIKAKGGGGQVVSVVELDALKKLLGISD